MLARVNTNQILATVIAVFAVVYLYGAYDIRTFPIPRPIDSDLIPKVLGFLMLGLAILLFFQKPEAAEEAEASAAPPAETLPWIERPKVQVLLTIVGIAAYAALLRPLGFVLASALLVGGFSALYGFRRWGINAAVATAVPLFLYLVLTRAMGINLPRGVLPF
jgi:putative tricarboxylic transport membrane protein